jgi:hypothetical protein
MQRKKWGIDPGLAPQGCKKRQGGRQCNAPLMAAVNEEGKKTGEIDHGRAPQRGSEDKTRMGD